MKIIFSKTWQTISSAMTVSRSMNTWADNVAERKAGNIGTNYTETFTDFYILVRIGYTHLTFRLDMSICLCLSVCLYPFLEQNRRNLMILYLSLCLNFKYEYLGWTNFWYKATYWKWRFPLSIFSVKYRKID